MLAQSLGPWIVPGSDGLALPVAAAAGSPTASASLTFRFPRSVFVRGLLILPDADPAFFTSMSEQLSQLAVSIVDETTQPIVSDSRGTLQGSNRVPVAAGLLMLFGRAFRPYALQRPVEASDQWTFTIQNAHPVLSQTLGGIYLYFDKATR
jgi:hypothetical protein